MACFICGNSFAVQQSLTNPTRYRVVCNSPRCGGLEYQMPQDMIQYWANSSPALLANIGSFQYLNTPTTIAEVAQEGCIAKPR